MKNLKLLTEKDFAVASDVKYLSYESHAKTLYLANDDWLFGYDIKTGEETWSFQLPRTKYGIVKGLQAYQGDDGEKLLCVSFDTGAIYTVDVEKSSAEFEANLEGCAITSMSWSPDQEIVLLATDQSKVVAFTRNFDVIGQVDLLEEGFGAQKFMNVGWGRKETQFQGKSGKLVKVQEKAEKTQEAVDTNTNVAIVWRGDGTNFACSFVRDGQRLFRCYNREFELQYTSEVLPGIESCFTWKPLGDFIATTQRKEDAYKLALFEMNGLKYTDFYLPQAPYQYIVTKLQWSSDSTILMALCETISGSDACQSEIMLWTSSNCTWMLKQKLSFDCRVSTVEWDDSEAQNLHVVTANGRYHLYRWGDSIDGANSLVNRDGACFSYRAVVDGNKVKLSPFSYMTVPPPHCCYKLNVNQQVREVFFSQYAGHADDMAVLTSNNQLWLFTHKGDTSERRADPDIAARYGIAFELEFRPGKKEPVYPMLRCYGKFNLKECDILGKSVMRHPVWVTSDVIVGAVSSSDLLCDNLVCVNLCEGEQWNCQVAEHGTDSIEGKEIVSICSLNFSVLLLYDSGDVMEYSLESNLISRYSDYDGNPVTLSSDFTKCQVLPLPGEEFKLLALSVHQELRVDNELVSNECTSFAISRDFVLITTSWNKLFCIPIESFEGHSFAGLNTASKRSLLERKSEIVAHTSGYTDVVLQAPRGNLEVIHPRALVVSLIKVLLDSSRYGRAFDVMRRHRINLNLMYDHNPNNFLTYIPRFVEQVNREDFLSIFLCDLKSEDFTTTMYKMFYRERNAEIAAKADGVIDKSKIDKRDVVCDALIEHFKTLPIHKVLFARITAHIMKPSSEIKQALLAVKESPRHTPPLDIMTLKALRYLMVLVDSNTVFRKALGTYDLDLALMVKQESKDDPKEYLPFLNELKSLDVNMSRYRIDMHLKLYAKALSHLAECPGKFSDCVALIEEKGLYREALKIFSKKEEAQIRTVTTIYADHLVLNHSYREAGNLLQRCGLYEKAHGCFMRSIDCWRESLNTARLMQCDQAQLEKIAKILVVRLEGNQRYLEAAEILQDHMALHERAARNLINGSYWDKAVNVIYTHALYHLIDSDLKPRLVSYATTLIDNLLTSLETFQRYKHRLMVVRENKLKAAEESLDGRGDYAASDIASDFGTVTTATSRTTGSRFSQATTARNRRKQEKKRLSMKPGSRFEEEGLLNALHELYKKVETSIENISALLHNLTLHGLDTDAEKLQKTTKSVVDDLKGGVATIWPITPPDVEHVFNEHPLMKMCSNAESLEDVRVFLPPRLNFAKFEMHSHSL